jgi:hypothetical protein
MQPGSRTGCLTAFPRKHLCNNAIDLEINRREAARRRLDSLEGWLRRLIEHQLSAAHGSDYFMAQLPDGASVIKSDVRRRAEERKRTEPTRFARLIDATELNDAISIVLHPNLYSRYFRTALAIAFPLGPDWARVIFNRLVEIRNKLAHGGPCSQRDLERVVCYGNDVIESVKEFYVEANKERLFNVPMIIRMVDSKGHDVHLPLDRTGGANFDARGRAGTLHFDDSVTIEIEVDPSFSPHEYTIEWAVDVEHEIVAVGSSFTLVANRKYVGNERKVFCFVRSSADWHRLYGDVDDQMIITYRILPPHP